MNHKKSSLKNVTYLEPFFPEVKSRHEKMLFRQLHFSSSSNFPKSETSRELKWTKWVSPGPNAIRRSCNLLKLIILERRHGAPTMPRTKPAFRLQLLLRQREKQEEEKQELKAEEDVQI